MSRATRSATIRRRLVEGGLIDLGLDEAAQKAGPAEYDGDGFSTRQHHHGDTLVVIAGAYGPNWLRTLVEVTGRLESPHVKCTVLSLPELGDHEVIVRWSTSAELQARKAAQAAHRAELKQESSRREARERAEDGRRELEAAGCDTGQPGLF